VAEILWIYWNRQEKNVVFKSLISDPLTSNAIIFFCGVFFTILVFTRFKLMSVKGSANIPFSPGDCELNLNAVKDYKGKISVIVSSEILQASQV